MALTVNAGTFLPHGAETGSRTARRSPATAATVLRPHPDAQIRVGVELWQEMETVGGSVSAAGERPRQSLRKWESEDGRFAGGGGGNKRVGRSAWLADSASVMENLMVWVPWVLVFVGMAVFELLGASGKIPRFWAIVLGALVAATLPFGMSINLAHSEGVSVLGYWRRLGGGSAVIEALGFFVPGGFVVSWICMNWAALYVNGIQRKGG